MYVQYFDLDWNDNFMIFFIYLSGVIIMLKMFIFKSHMHCIYFAKVYFVIYAYSKLE